jgi:hypothetical protein
MEGRRLLFIEKKPFAFSAAVFQRKYYFVGRKKPSPSSADALLNHPCNGGEGRGRGGQRKMQTPPPLI